MDNPYWESDGQTHHLNLDSIKNLCFDLLNIFEASKPIAEELSASEALNEAHINLSDFPLAILHRELAFKKSSELLLQLALMIRTYDDQMRGCDQAKEYAAFKENNDSGDYIGTLEGKDSFRIREACNKIIHAQEVRPIYDRTDINVFDSENGGMSQDIWYLTGEIELSGKFGDKNWDAVVYLQPFLETCLSIIEFGNPSNDKIS